MAPFERSTTAENNNNVLSTTIVVNPNSSVDASKSSGATLRQSHCPTGSDFLKTVNGILNIVTIIFLVLVVICAGVVESKETEQVDQFYSSKSSVISAFHTRNAILTFAVVGALLLIADTVLHVSGQIHQFPVKFELVFNSVMLVFAVIFLILGCCAAAWEQKMRDATLVSYETPGAAAGAAAFLFLSMVLVLFNFTFRFFRPAIVVFEKN